MTLFNNLRSLRLRVDSAQDRQRWFRSLCLTTGLALIPSAASAQDAPQQVAEQKKPAEIVLPKSYDGEEDFEEATRLRLKVDSIETLNEVVSLAESALKKGLDEADQEAAKKMLATLYLQKTELMISTLREGGKRLSPSRQNKLLNDFVEDLSQAIEYDPLLIDAYLRKIELHASRKELKEAKEVADAGVEKILPLVENTRVEPELKLKLSKLLMMRAGLQEEPDDIVSDLKKSIQTNPNNTASIILLAKSLIENNKIDEAITFFQSMLETNPDNEVLIRSTAELMASDEKRIDESLGLLETKIKLLPKSSDLLKLRAKINSARAVGATDEDKRKEILLLAQTDLDKALELSKEDVESLLYRARVLLQSNKVEEAKRDVDTAIELDPNRIAAIELRATVAAEQNRYADAINDLQMIIKNEPKDGPKNPLLLLKLGFLYVQDNRQTMAIKVFDQVIKLQPDVWEPYRFRGDARLSVFDYENAIADFEKALELAPEDEEDRSGILNNLSWILSTSEPDGIRDGKRALELGLQACELTKYGKQHILSTLAAAYGELGEFDKAIEWSEKAVQLAKERNDEQVEQYENELKSYKEGKPWREKMESKENKAPIAPADAGVET